MKALVLLSGGLDSTLAARLSQELGLELIAFNTVSPFCTCAKSSRSGGCLHSAGSAASMLGLRLVSVDVASDLLEIIRRPRHGFGSHMNPCIDCRILLFCKAREAMAHEGASFIITGEVVGQRPMSQKTQTLRLIEREAGLEGLVVRPLSAKRLQPTVPERRGWIDREKLMGINGRSRQEQMRMAAEFGINDYPCPAGGCLLTDPLFSLRIRDLVKHEQLTVGNVRLSKLGRYFRLSPRTFLIVGRNQSENERIEKLWGEGDCLFQPPDIAGPTSLARGECDEGVREKACRITARYCDLAADEPARILVKNSSRYTRHSLPARDTEIDPLRV